MAGKIKQHWGEIELPCTAKSGVQIQVNPTKTCFGQWCKGRCFSPNTLPFPASIIPPILLLISILMYSDQKDMRGDTWTPSNILFGPSGNNGRECNLMVMKLAPRQSSNKNAKIQLKQINPSLSISSLWKQSFLSLCLLQFQAFSPVSSVRLLAG